MVKDVVKRWFSGILQKEQSAKTLAFSRLPGISDFSETAGVLHAPKAGALPTALHPDIRQKKLAAFRFRLAAKTAHPLRPSSFPNRTRFAGLRSGVIQLQYSTPAVVVRHAIMGRFFREIPDPPVPADVL